MTDLPKKHRIAGLDFANFGKARSTKIPTARTAGKIHKPKMRWRRIAIDAGVLALIILIAYATSLFGGFVFNDHYIDKFIAIRIGDENFWSNLVLKGISQPLSQPWITASFAFDLQSFGLEAIWYHIVNMLLHFLCCFYFYILIYRLVKHFWPQEANEEPLHAVPLLAAALLACHPLACESVGHIAGRPATIMACNFFLAINFFLSGFLSTKVRVVLRNYIFSFSFYLMAIFSDCQGLALPAVMFLLALLLKAPGLSYKNWFQKKWADFIFVGFLAFLGPLSALHGFNTDFSNGFASPLPNSLVYILSQFRGLIVYYLRCLLVPLGLSIYPPFVTASDAIDPLAILGIIAIAIAFYLVYKLRNEPLAAFGLGIAVISFLPPIFFIQNEIAADRRFYLCIAGLALLFAVKLKYWLAPGQKDYRIRICACLLIVMFSMITAARNCDFLSDINLFTAATRVNNKDAWAKGMLALSLVNANRADRAIAMAHEAIKINKDCQPAYLALGEAHLPSKSDSHGAQAMYKSARGELEIALSLAKTQHLGPSQLFESQTSLASALVELGEYQKAKALAGEALTVNPSSVLLNLILGRSLNALGKYMDALRCLDKGFTRDQTNPDYMEPLAEAALGVGTASTISAAYNIAETGLGVKPTSHLHLLLARAAFAMKKIPESIKWTETLLQENPNNAQAMYLHSFQLILMRQMAEAKKLRTQALELDPDLKVKMPILIVNKKNNTVIHLENLPVPNYPEAKYPAPNYIHPLNQSASKQK